jgi:hypothetical protein
MARGVMVGAGVEALFTVCRVPTGASVGSRVMDGLDASRFVETMGVDPP